jgi:hypothetical protein
MPAWVIFTLKDKFPLQGGIVHYTVNLIVYPAICAEASVVGLDVVTDCKCLFLFNSGRAVAFTPVGSGVAVTVGRGGERNIDQQKKCKSLHNGVGYDMAPT